MKRAWITGADLHARRIQSEGRILCWPVALEEIVLDAHFVVIHKTLGFGGWMVAAVLLGILAWTIVRSKADVQL